MIAFRIFVWVCELICVQTLDLLKVKVFEHNIVAAATIRVREWVALTVLMSEVRLGSETRDCMMNIQHITRPQRGQSDIFLSPPQPQQLNVLYSQREAKNQQYRNCKHQSNNHYHIYHDIGGVRVDSCERRGESFGSRGQKK